MAMGKYPKKLTLWLYRHVINDVVLLSVRDRLKPQHLEQIKNSSVRPPQLRKDHWVPIAAVEGFQRYEALTSVFNRVLHGLHSRPKERNPRRKQQELRDASFAPKFDIMSSAREGVKLLCRSLSEVRSRNTDRGSDGSIARYHIFWELESLKDLPGLQWPDNVAHEKMIVERGRHVKNERLQRTPWVSEEHQDDYKKTARKATVANVSDE